MLFDFFKGIFGVQSFFKFPVVRADDDDDDEDELVDPSVGLKEACKKNDPHVLEWAKKLAECEARVRSKKFTRETCEEELHYMVKYIDHCCAKELFNYLK